ncbi:Sphinganine C(4)-monooxygenase 1 [Apostasia shenzhenica]|uniref:aldehyde oxygenase (deformylating) n=1 Tax=Apostasia shenzhenica TaxID=1088818 RepID=A0A2I0AMG6_9ASPA|nr:Sphinganine C(4)-monooxygenase 1 [Apostasia shenzhenica]
MRILDLRVWKKCIVWGTARSSQADCDRHLFITSRTMLPRMVLARRGQDLVEPSWPSHPLDGLIVDTGGGAIAFLVSGMTPRTATLFVSLTTIKGIDDHSGLWLPGKNFLQAFFKHNTAFHGIHHQSFGSKYNFSNPFFVTWDKLLGTYMPYKIEKRQGGGFEARPLENLLGSIPSSMLLLDTQIKSLHASAITNPQKQYQDPKVKLSLRTLVPPVADKRREPRACPPHFLRKTRIRLHYPLPTNTKESEKNEGGLAPGRAKLLYHLL